MTALLEDGVYTTPGIIGPKRVRWPFLSSYPGDKYAKITEWDLSVRTESYVPTSPDRTSWTNYLLYSEVFANAAWTKLAITNTDNSLANPSDGAVTMASGLETTANSEHSYAQAYTFTAVQHTLSWIIKPNGRTWFRLKANDGTTDFTAFFQLTGDGTVGTVANCTGAVHPATNGSYRVSITFTPAAAAGNVYLNYATDGSTVSYSGNASLGAYVWGAQIVRASTAGPYISTTTALRAISAPSTDYIDNSAADAYADPFAYLCAETNMELWGTGAYQKFTRPYARIPGAQVTYPGSRYFPLPAIANTQGESSAISVNLYPVYTSVGGGFYNANIATIYTEYQQALYGPVKALTARVIGYATAGTLTLTFGADTTAALNWNDTGATIATAINGLSSVIAAGLTATVTNSLAVTTGGSLHIVWSVATTVTLLTMSAASLTVTTSKNPVTVWSSPTVQDIFLPYHYTVTGHGFNTAVSLALAANDGTSIGIYPTATWGSIDANTIWTIDSSTTSVAGSFKRTYAPGKIYLLRTRVTENFFLPGVSVGITTPTDITVDAGLQNPEDFVNALMTLTGWQTHETEGPAPWLGGPQYRRAYTAINLDDIS